MKQIENSIMLITYPNSLGSNLKELGDILDTHFSGAVGGIHILPFYPSSGDRGFAVISYEKVDPAWGSWDDIDSLAEKYYLGADFMLNHISVRSHEFQDYLEKGDVSEYSDMFINWGRFWPDGEPSEEDLAKMYRRKPGGPYISFMLGTGKTVRLWNTFFQEQIDINPYAKPTQDYFDRNLGKIASHVPLIRFDAFAYASKKPGSTCFFVEPEIWDILDIAMRPLRRHGTQMLAEIHEKYTYQLKMASKGYWVYDFALPMLLLHATLTGQADRLAGWLKICPHNQFTTLDTHDGIGVVDVAGLLTDDEIEFVCESVEQHIENVKQYWKSPMMIKTNGQKAKRYQLAGTYYSAMGCNDNAYLLARAVQFYCPGIPQIYYVGMLAGKNDDEFVINGGELRDLNRHNYTREEVLTELRRPVVQKLLTLCRFRNSHPSFSGEIEVEYFEDRGILCICRRAEKHWSRLTADFAQLVFTIEYTGEETGTIELLKL